MRSSLICLQHQNTGGAVLKTDASKRSSRANLLWLTGTSENQSTGANVTNFLRATGYHQWYPILKRKIITMKK